MVDHSENLVRCRSMMCDSWFYQDMERSYSARGYCCATCDPRNEDPRPEVYEAMQRAATKRDGDQE